MFDSFSQRLAALLIPVMLLSACGIALVKISIIPQEWQTVLIDTLPILALVIGLIVSLQFNRSRYTFLLIFLSTATLSLLFYREKLSPGALNLIFAGLFINTFIFSLSKDRGLFSVHGVIRLVFLVFQIQLGLYFLIQYPELISKLITTDLFILPKPLTPYLKLQDPLLIVALSVIVLHLLSVFVLRNYSVQATFLGCQVGLLGMISGYQSETLVPLLMATCCVIICISIIVNSYDMAYTDELTGLPSRRALNQYSLSLGRNYTIAMLDIDHFKKFNDTHGHDVGDDVLRMVASKIGKVTGGGKAFRYGGEEFTIIFPRKSAHQVEAHLDSLRKTIEHYEMVVRSKVRASEKNNKDPKNNRGKENSKPKKFLSVTISIGIAERRNDHRNPDDVIKSADQALYRAKKKGRNCVST